MKKDLILLAASLVAPVMVANAEVYDDFEIPVLNLDVDEGVSEPENYFMDVAPWKYLPEQCAIVADASSPCNTHGESFSEFIREFNDDPDFRLERVAFTNYSTGESIADKMRFFDFTLPYYDENGITPVIARKAKRVNGVENFATFYAVTEERVGYQVVVSKKENYMMAALGFVRIGGRWYCTASNVTFIDYK